MAEATRPKQGYVRGEPTRFVNAGHAQRFRRQERAAQLPEPNPSGLCMCGCEQPTRIAKYTNKQLGWTVGKPVPYLRGHRARKLSKTQEDEVCRRYQAGESGEALGKAFGVSKKAIYGVLERNGVMRRPDNSEPKFDDAQELAICDRYLSGLSSEKVGHEYGCAATTVQDILRRNGFGLRSVGRRREYTCDDAFFDEIDDEIKAYWLGFAAADGSVVGNTFTVKLARRDRDHLLRLRDALRCTNPVSETTTNGFAQSYLSVTSEGLVLGLISHGIVPRKSFTLEWPGDLPGSLLRHYLRGYVDGDGGFYAYPVKARSNQGPTLIFSFVASLPFALGARDYLAEAAEATKSRLVPARENGRVHTLSYRGAPQVGRIYRLLHDDASVFLPRKRENVAPYVRLGDSSSPLPNLSRLRSKAGLSQHELGRWANVKQATIDRIERTGSAARPLTIRKLASALNVAPADLMEYTDSSL